MDEKIVFFNSFGREQVALGYEVSQEVGKIFIKGSSHKKLSYSKTIRTYFGKYRKG